MDSPSISPHRVTQLRRVTAFFCSYSYSGWLELDQVNRCSHLSSNGTKARSSQNRFRTDFGPQYLCPYE
jgi:hypothetical protein